MVEPSDAGAGATESGGAAAPDGPVGYANVDVELVAIPGGTFAMGSAEAGEGPVHEVTISPFSLMKFEVTAAQFVSVFGRDPSPHAGDARKPVSHVSFYEAIELANAFSRAAGLEPSYSLRAGSPYGDTPEVLWNRNATGFRLPTEAEWEYAARAGTTTETYGGDLLVRQFACQQDSRLDPIAVYCRSGSEGPLPVGSRAPNAFGLHDMLGNVWEWVWDWEPSFFPSSYDPGAVKDPTGKNGNGAGARILRGGSWFWPPRSSRSAARIAHIVNAEYSHADFGFRLAAPVALAGKQTIRVPLPRAPEVPRPSATSATVEMVSVPGGTFAMGMSPAASRMVTVSPFQMSKTEVTVGQYIAVMGKAPPYHLAHYESPDLPVGGMSWYDVALFANALSAKEGLTPAYTIRQEVDRPGNPAPPTEYVVWNEGASGYRIPTEAEWEYAARAGATTNLPGGNRTSNAEACTADPLLDAVAWYCASSQGKPHPVGTKRPNAFGLYDMLGNMSEWTWDWFAPPATGPESDPRGPATPGPQGRFKVVRGGSYLGSTALHSHGARGSHIVNQMYGHHDYGIRLAR